VKVDTVKATFTYLTAYTIIVGGGAFLYQTYADPRATEVGIIAIVSGFIGAAIQFVFGQEIQSRTAHQAAAATLAATPTTTVSAGPPASVTVAPAPASGVDG
jgi:dihydrofolate reductase